MGVGAPRVDVETKADTAAKPVAAEGERDQQSGPGRGRVQALLRHGGVPDAGAIADVLVLYPGETSEIAQILQTTPALGNQFTQRVFDLVRLHADSNRPKAAKKADRFQSGDFGEDPVDETPLTGDAKLRSENEAAALSKLRADSRRFNPDFMLALQTRLGVADKSGLLNRETLRALLDKSPQLTAVKELKSDSQVAQAVSIILANNKNWLGEPEVDLKAPKQAGDPPTASPIAEKAFTDTGTGWGKEARKPTNNTDIHDGDRADRVAHALGYSSYADYWGGLEVAKFLGLKLDGNGSSSGRAHPALTGRLRIAEAWLQQRHPDVKDDLPKLRERIGWHHGGNAAYADNADDIGKNGFKGNKYEMGVHMHSFGLAIDIDPGHNPYVFGGSAKIGTVNHYWNKNMEMHLRRAAQLFGGEAITAEKLEHWSNTLSTDELYGKVEKATAALKQYLELPKTVTLPAAPSEKKASKAERAAQRKEADQLKQEAIAQRFVAKGYSPEEAETAAYDLLDFTEDGHDGKETAIWNELGRRDSPSLTTHSRDLVIALRDVAGLMWGGTEMSGVENGDFMHFDLRNTSYGQAVGAAHKAQSAATDADRDVALAEEKKNQGSGDAPPNTNASPAK